MSIDGHIEDLEALFENQLEEPLERTAVTNFVRVRALDGNTTEMAAPILGSDFIAGIALVADVFMVFPFDSVFKIELLNLKNPGLPSLREVEICLREVIRGLDLPHQIDLLTKPDGQRLNAVLLAVKEQSMLIETQSSEVPLIVPISSLSRLNFVDVENFGRNLGGSSY